MDAPLSMFKFLRDEGESRLSVEIAENKNGRRPDRARYLNTLFRLQIVAGTGRDVSDEDINDAKTPLQIKWRNDSYVRIPIWK